MPGRAAVIPYGERKANKYGLAATFAFHLMLVLAYLFRPDDAEKAGKARESLIVMVPPLGQPKSEQAPLRPREFKQELPRVEIPRLPDTITLPDVKPVETPRETRQPPPEMDVAAMIEARRRARGAITPPAAEGENDKAMRNINANIARASGQAVDDGNNTGGIFDITDKTFHSAQLKFKGWNPNFKRRWLQQVTVEQGSAPDLETAIVDKMIEIIRKEKPGDFEWRSHRLDRVVTMSARKEHTAELHAFLYREMFCPRTGSSGDARCRAQSR
jgi:hypothetical protein